MPTLAAISTIDFPFKADQQEIKKLAKSLFDSSFPEIERILSAFDNSEIETRNLCKPLDYYTKSYTFQEQNLEYIQLSLEYSIKAIEACLSSAQLNREDITDFIFVSSTGLATPSMDALIINKMRLNQHANRMSIFGLGCGGGVSGYAKACTLAKANDEAVVLLVAAELCSLTFLQNDFSKSNFIGASLFADGIAACIITGDKRVNKSPNKIKFVASESKLYFDSLNVMGWDFMNSGFKVLFSRNIPAIISKNIYQDVTPFLAKNQLEFSDIKNFIFHPGGKKVLTAYEEALDLKADSLAYTREIMKNYGNMSSSTVLYVLERFFTQDFENGYGLMVALGPGFSCDFVLLQMQK
jgi:alkylresorcinol/alkylpyrone synthase